ncbi:hypothetical protein AAE478_000029 [Parahypoxylon ruwenzoriense]
MQDSLAVKPHRIAPAPRPIRLKQSTDVSLLTAFGEEQWTNAANLARQRHKVTKDPYFLAVEIAAKSQSENVADRNAGKVAVDNMIRDGIIIKDVDALDLYEFSCSRIDIEYSETIGLLRSRLVKALPKDQYSSTRCFDACMWNSDWKNAQQIAASLHKNFKDRKFLFQYIMATHIYALSSECPEGSKKVFGTLAKALADKAFDLRAVTVGEEYHLDRAVITEPEAWLWVSIRISHCKPEENLRLFRQPGYSPIAFLEDGLDEPFKEVMRYLQYHDAWDDIFRIGTKILDTAIHINQTEAEAIDNDEKVAHLQKLADREAQQEPPIVESSVKKELIQAIEAARPMRSMTANFYITSCCNWTLYANLFQAAKYQPDRKRGLKQVRQSFDKLIKALTRAGNMRPLFQKTRDVIALATLFERDSQVQSTPDGSTTRVCYLTDYLVTTCDDPRCFDQAVAFIKELNEQETVAFLGFLNNEAMKCSDVFQHLAILSLRLKIRYFLATTIESTCQACSTKSDDAHLALCLTAIADNALDIYNSGINDYELRQNRLPLENVDPLSDTAVVGAMCLLRLAGLGRDHRRKGMKSPLHEADTHLFFKAVLWLDSYVLTSPLKHNAHRMLLSKLYLLMGCASRAKTLWDGFDVKNAIIDSLGLLFIDRLSSIAPGLFILSPSRENPVEPFIVHFTRAFKRTFPSTLTDCLEQGTYSNVQTLFQRAFKQATSYTLAMSVVEERRGSRLRTGRVETSIEDQPLVRNLSVEQQLEDITDYQALPRFDGKNAAPIHEIVSYGPLPSHVRAHLGLLAERFLDFVCYVQPKEYKPSKAGQVIQLDWEYALAASTDLHKKLGALLSINDPESPEEANELSCRLEEVAKSLTGPEASYYIMLWELSRLVKRVLKHIITSPSTGKSRDLISSVVNDVLGNFDSQNSNFLMPINESVGSKVHIFQGFVDLHAMGMMRESILAVKYTANYLTLALDKAKNTDKARASADGAWLVTELKKMTAAALEAENTIKYRVKLLKSSLDNIDGWRNRLRDWTFGDYTGIYDQKREWKKSMGERMAAAIPKTTVEKWIDEVGESWRELMKGWAVVKFD